MRAEIIQEKDGRKLLRTRPTPAKLAALVFSLAITLVGALELVWVARHVFGGKTCDAKVVSVMATAPGMAPQEFQPGAAATQSSATSFLYFVDCGEAGQKLELNVGNKGSPTFAVGDTVRVAHGADGEPLAVAVRDFRTWSVGVFVTSTGMLYLIVISSILWRGRKPVEIPQDETL
jgi:hypothetical protein